MVDFSGLLSGALLDLRPENWDKFVKTIDARFRALEQHVISQDAVANEVLLRGLQQVDEYLTPVVTGADATINATLSSATAAISTHETAAEASIANVTAAALAAANQISSTAQTLGALLQATSSSTITIATGRLTFIIDEGVRPLS